MWCLCGAGIDHDERGATLQQRAGNKGTYAQHGRERYRVSAPNVSTATSGVRADSQGASGQEQASLDAANARGAPNPSLMTVEQLAQATQEFASTCVIGRGGFGTVYRGMIDLKPVAIKVMDDAGMQGVDEYRNELTVLARLDHPNIVRLVGFTAPDAQKLCLVSELMAHGSLEDRLLGRKPGMKRLPWSIRLRCASELATALAYLHSQQPPLCHRDIKPANVFLDSNQHAKLGDVGLARFLGPRPPAEVATQPAGEAGEEEVLVGDYHYLPPEYKRTGQVSLEMDVYAFGVTLLQILSGREPVGLVKQVRNAVNDYRLQSVMDPHGGPGLDERLALRLAKLALWCCNSKPADRPSMSVIAPQLESSLQSIRI